MKHKFQSLVIGFLIINSSLFSQIKAFCYINWDWEYWSNKIGFKWHDWKDARIQLNDYVKENYKGQLKNKIFIHSQNK